MFESKFELGQKVIHKKDTDAIGNISIEFVLTKINIIHFKDDSVFYDTDYSEWMEEKDLFTIEDFLNSIQKEIV